AGRASSADAHAQLRELGRYGVPAGVEVTSIDIAPPLAAPYEWRARFDGARVTFSGHAPSDGFAAALVAAAGEVPVATSLALASGAPAAFEEKTLALLANLLRLEAGEAAMTDAAARLSGAPADAASAAAIRRALDAAGV